MLKIILALLFQLSYQSTTYIQCKEDEIYFHQINWTPIYEQNTMQEQNQLIQNQEILEIITKVSISNLSEEGILIQKSFEQNQLQLIFLDQGHYICKLIRFKFNLENNIFKNYEEILINKIIFELPICTKLLKTYQVNQLMYILCEEEQIIQLFVLARDQNNTHFDLTIQSSSSIDKIPFCDTQFFYQREIEKIYLSLLNCSDWVIYVVNNNKFEVIVNASDLNNTILISFAVDKQILLQFEHQVCIFWNKNLISQMYENQNQKILYIFGKQINPIIFIKGDEIKIRKLDFNLFVTAKEQPKQVLQLDGKIIINYDGYLCVLESIDTYFIVNISIDNLIDDIFYYPYILAFSKDQIVVLQKNYLNQTISCQQLMKKEVLYFKSNYLFSFNQFSKIEIFNQDQIQTQEYNLSLHNKSFSFQIPRISTIIRGLTPIIQFSNSSNLGCIVQQFGKELICDHAFIKNAKWKIFKFKQDFYILFQRNNQQLYVKNCNTNMLMELGWFEIFKENNIYEFRNYFLLVFSNKTKVLIITLKQNQFNQSIIQFKDQIIDIFYQNSQIWIITNQCQSYNLVHHKQLLQKSDIYVSVDGQCISNKISYEYIGYVHKGSIITSKNNITNLIKFENAQAVDFIGLSSNKNFFIIELKYQDNHELSKYLFLNNQFIKLYTFPKYHFKYSSPLKYQITKYLLIVAAHGNYDNRVLLVYYFDNQLSNSLIEIIEVDDYNFSITDEDILIYNFNAGIRMIKLKQLQFQCEVNEFTQFVKKISFPLNYTSKYNISQEFNIRINLNLFNNIENLSLNEFKDNQISFDLQDQFLPLNPREYINGPINQIISQNIIIIEPIQKVGQISKDSCETLINQVCINKNNQLIIYNNFKQQETITLELGSDKKVKNIFKYQDLILVLIQKEMSYYITLYNKFGKNQYTIEVPLPCVFNVKIAVYLNFCFLFCPYMIQLFKIHHYTLESFSIIDSDCEECSIMEIANSQKLLLYQQSKNNQISLITINDDVYQDQSNRTQVQIFQQLPQIQSRFIIQNATFLNNSQYGIIIVEIQKGILQYYEAFLNANQSSINLKNGSIILRHFQYLENIIKVSILDRDLILIHFSNSQQKSQLIIYNVSNAFNFKFIDYIFRLEIDKGSNIIPYDDQHFIIHSLEEYTLYKIFPYRLKLDREIEGKIEIEFQNSVSSLKMEIRKKNQTQLQIPNLMNNYFFFGIGIIILIFCIYCVLKQKKKNRILIQKNCKEIEL